MKLPNDELIKDLQMRMERAIQRAMRLREEKPEVLNKKITVHQWSALECLEHLNLYGDFYLPEIEKQLSQAVPLKGIETFRSGIIGNYFATLMQRNKKGSLKKMKAPADKMPPQSGLNSLTIDRFLKQSEKLRQLIGQAATVDLTKTKTAISLTRALRLRLGDTLRFVVYHIERHLDQAERSVML